MNLSKEILLSPPQRAKGRVFVTAHAPSRLGRLRQEGAYRYLFPARPDGSLEAVLLNTAGGIAAGDTFAITAKAEDGAILTLTTQAAERIYGRAKHPGSTEVATQRTDLTVGGNGALFWLPQETILFDRAALQRRLNVRVAKTARYLMVEPLVFGRQASREQINTIHFSDRITITCDETPIYLDAINLTENMTGQLARTAIGNGAKAMANLVFFAPEAAQMLEKVRPLLPDSAGASLLDENLLVARFLAQDSYLLRKSLVPILQYLTHQKLPKSWRL